MIGPIASAAHRLFCSIAIIALLAGCAGAPFQAATLQRLAPERALDELSFDEYWTGIALDGEKIGLSRLSLVAAGSDGKYGLQMEAALRFRMPGTDKRVTLSSIDRVGPDLALCSFAYVHDLDGHRLEVAGEVRDSVLVAELRSGEQRKMQRLLLPATVYPTSAIALYPLVHGLEVGRRHAYLVNDGETQALATVTQEVLGYETSERFPGGAFKLRTVLHGQETYTWIDAHGRPALQIAMNGALISRLEDPAAWREPPAVDLNGAAVQLALRSSLVAPSDHPRINEAALSVGTFDADGEALARALVAWIGEHIEHEAVDVFTALDVLGGGRAECQGHAYLYAALARARGLPTRIVNGLVYAEALDGFLYHSWAESLVEGRWLPVDPTFGQVPVDATHIRLIDGERLADIAPMVDAVGRLRIEVLDARR